MIWNELFKIVGVCVFFFLYSTCHGHVHAPAPNHTTHITDIVKLIPKPKKKTTNLPMASVA